MKKLSFKRQLQLGIVLLVSCFILSTLFRNGIFSNIAWILYGILFILNPVYPERSAYFMEENRARDCARLAGAICIVIGLITKFGVGV